MLTLQYSGASHNDCFVQRWFRTTMTFFSKFHASHSDGSYGGNSHSDFGTLIRITMPSNGPCFAQRCLQKERENWLCCNANFWGLQKEWENWLCCNANFLFSSNPNCQYPGCFVPVRGRYKTPCPCILGSLSHVRFQGWHLSLWTVFWGCILCLSKRR